MEGYGLSNNAVNGDPAVVALIGDSGTANCTGTLIAPRVVVTAAHCILNGGPEWVSFGRNAHPGGGGTRVRVIARRTHPGWRDIYSTPQSDVALLTLEREVSVESVPLFADPLPITALGKKMRIVGFGRTATEPAGLKRFGMAKVSDVASSIMRHRPFPAATCPGDSGGPGFMKSNGVEVLVAVHSTGSCGGESSKVLVGQHIRSFILPYLLAVQGGGQPIAIPAPRREPPAGPAIIRTVPSNADEFRYSTPEVPGDPVVTPAAPQEPPARPAIVRRAPLTAYDLRYSTPEVPGDP